MTAEDKVKVLEDEFKLIKSELRQTLVSVRDFLLDLRLPPVQDEAADPLPVAHAQADEGNKNDGFGSPYQPDTNQPSTMPEHVPANEARSEPFNPPVQDYIPQEEPETFEPVEEPVDEQEESFDFDDEDDEMVSGDMPGEEEEEEETTPVVDEKEVKPVPVDQSGSPASQINVLANLMRWSAVARNEIGFEQLPTFLDLYSVGGKLPPQTKYAILHIAGVVAEPVMDEQPVSKHQIINEQIALCMEINGFSFDLPQGLKDKLRKLTDLVLKQSGYSSKAEIWSQLMLELHGILTGNVNTNQEFFDLEGLASYNGIISADDMEVVEEIEVEEDEPEKKPVKKASLRLVFPADEDQEEQEIELGDLTLKAEETEKKSNGRKSAVA